jgi:hypothetical protein
VLRARLAPGAAGHLAALRLHVSPAHVVLLGYGVNVDLADSLPEVSHETAAGARGADSLLPRQSYSLKLH